MGRPRLPDEVKKARGTFRPSRAAGAAVGERYWPVRDPSCADRELQDEAVTELRRLHDAIVAQLVVDGKPNPLLDQMERVEALCIANGVLLPSRQGEKSLLRMMAEGCLNE